MNNISKLVEDIITIDHTMLFILTSLIASILLFIVVKFIVKTKEEIITFGLLLIFQAIVLVVLYVSSTFMKSDLEIAILEQRPTDWVYRFEDGTELTSKEISNLNKKAYNLKIDYKEGVIVVSE